MATNPNWPVVTITADFSAGPPNNVPGVNKVAINAGNVAVTDFNTKRGHVYELDTVQAGTATLIVSDPDEKLNPANTGSPWNSGVNKLKPYRVIQIQAQWPPVTGTTYDVYTGYIERYPLTWEDMGARGIKPLTAVDALSVASRTAIVQNYASEIAIDHPSFTIPLDDAAAPGLTKGLSVGTMSQFLIAGGQVQWAGDTMPDGAKAVSLAQQVQDPATIPLSQQYAVIDSRLPAGPSEFSLNTGSATLEWCARLVQGGSTPLAFQQVLDGLFENSYVSPLNFWCGMFAFGAGAHFLGCFDPLGSYISTGATMYPDGIWHHFALRFTPNASTPTNYDLEGFIDGVSGGKALNVGPVRDVGINSIHSHASTSNGDYQTNVSIARIAAYAGQLSNARILAHANRLLGQVGELSDARALRLLNQYWSSDPTKRTVYSAAGLSNRTRMASDVAYDGRTLLDVLQEVTNADAGRIYANKSGLVIVEAKGTRDTLHNVSIGTFGEQENPYVAVSYDFDPTYVYSQSNLSSPNVTGAVITINTTAQADYGQRILSQTLQTADSFTLVQAGIYLKFAYSNATIRVEKMILDPAANPALWPIVLGLELSQRFTIKRRTSAGTVISADYYVEAIAHTVTGVGPTWSTEVELSPVFVNRAGVVGDATYGIVGSTAVLSY